MTFTLTKDHLTLCLCDDGEVTDALGRVLCGLRSEPHQQAADRAALAMYFAEAGALTKKEFRARWPRVRAKAREVLDTDNAGLRAGELTPELIRAAALGVR